MRGFDDTLHTFYINALHRSAAKARSWATCSGVASCSNPRATKNALGPRQTSTASPRSVIRPDDPHWAVGTDVQAHYGIGKYLPPIKFTAGDAEPNHPLFERYTEIENLRVRSLQNVAEGSRSTIPPQMIDIERQHMVEQIVTRRDGGEHVAHGVRSRLRDEPFRVSRTSKAGKSLCIAQQPFTDGRAPRWSSFFPVFPRADKARGGSWSRSG